MDSDFNFFTTVDLNYPPFDDGSVPYQFLYASMLYGTIFAIYGKFITEERNSGQSLVITKGYFLIKNYKGNNNLGFVPDEDVLGDKDETNLYFAVRKNSPKRNCDYDFKYLNHYEIRKGERRRLNINRILFPIEQDYFDIGDTDRPIIPPNGKMLKIPNPDMVEFDEEFKHRDGDEFLYRPLKPGMYGFQDIKDELDKQQNRNELLIASPRCHQSYVNIMY